METELEQVLMNCYKEEMISFVQSHPEVFNELIQLALANKQPYSWRAAWLLWSCMNENDLRVKKHIKTIIKSIESKQDGHQRELLKILLNTELKDDHEGIVFNICVNLWEQINKKPSIRYIAFRFIVKIVKKHPELRNEIDFLIQDHYMESLSPGVKHSISIMVKELNKDQ